MRKNILTLVVTWLLSMTAVAQQEVCVGTTATDGSIVLAAGSQTAPIVVSDGDAEVVTTVAQCLAEDVRAVTGKTLQVKTSIVAGEQPIFAGTIGQSTLIDQLAAAGKIDAKSVAEKWEVYGLQMVDNPVEGVDRALVVYGSTPRGTAYGLLELSRQMGVSYSVFNEILNGKRPVTIEYALLLEAVLGTSASIWLGLQTDYNMQKIKQDKPFMKRLKRLRKVAAML